MHRLVKRFAFAGGRVGRAQRSRRQHAQRTGKHGGHVRQHVAKQVVGDDNVELLGAPHQLHAAIVGQHMVQGDFGIFACMYAGDHLVPEDARLHHIAFFRRGHPTRPGFSQIKGNAGNAFNLVGLVNLRVDSALLAVAQIDNFLGLAEINPAGQLAHDHDVEPVDQLALEA